jgi:ribosome maturation factor RimP
MDLAQAASAVLTPLGFEVLEVRVTSRGRTRRVLVRIDRLDEGVVSVDDVALASEVFALELDRLDPIESAFLLEVESPGSERPLRTARHFERFHDLLAKVRSSGETFTGRIREVSDDSVVFETQEGRRSIPLSAIDGAWLAEWPDSPR